MARGGNCESGIPFMKPEDLHVWLISFALLMVLTSSLSFASAQFSPAGDPLWIDFAILVIWGIVFAACVIMWSLARLFNSEKTEWKLLYLSLFSVLVPRSCFPFRFGEYVMHQMCLMGFNFFNDHVCWKTNAVCGLTLILMTISDFAWKILPPFVALLKFYAFVVTVLVGNLGYRIVQVFYRQLREAKRPVRPFYALTGSSAGYRDKSIKFADSRKAATNEAVHSLLPCIYEHQNTGRTCELLRPRDPFSAKQRHLRPTRNNLGGSLSMRGFSRRSVMIPNAAATRRYWTKLDNCPPLYFQAVHRRLILCKDDMLRYVVEIEDSGVWNKEKEPQLFVVPRCHYGYVDSKWYLGMRLPGTHKSSLCCSSGNSVEDRQARLAISRTPDCETLNGAAMSIHPPAVAYTAPASIDSTTAVKRYPTLFRNSLSVGRSPSDTCRSGEGATILSNCVNGSPPLGTQQNAILQQYDGPQPAENVNGGTSAPDAPVQRFYFSCPPHKEEPTPAKEHLLPAGPPHSCHQGKCARRGSPHMKGGKRFFMPRRLRWKFGSAKSAECSSCPHLQEEARWCGCLRHPCAGESRRSGEDSERHTGSGSREEVVLPKVKGGVFEDSAIERWYLLWRAEYIICFYKEIYHINLLICALQCLFGMTRRYVIECLSLAIERYNEPSAAELEFLGVRAQMPSWTRTWAALWRPVLQFAILSALILPMKFMKSRGGKNVWKFQLLALGQAVTYMVFAFCELLGRCYIMATEPLFTAATKIPKGVELTCVVGSHLILPLFSIAVTVHLRRISEATIVVISAGSGLVTIVFLSFVGWEFKIAAFFMLSRTLYALFSIMLVRAFENVRRQLFATQVLPFLMYLSTLANSQRVESLCGIRRERDNCGNQQAQASSLP